jgi:GNAT superfamily N-acetyltransferase
MGEMDLSADAIRWLSTHFAHTATVDELDATYSFEHRFNGTRKLVRQCATGDRLEWRVEFVHGDTKTLVLPLDRHVVPSAKLRGAARWGRVAYNEMFQICEQYRRQGFGRALHTAELSRYAAWAIEEIHVEAVDDGLVVWPRLDFEPERPGLLARAFSVWSEKRGLALPPPAALRDYPDDFLREMAWLPLYKVVRRHDDY